MTPETRPVKEKLDGIRKLVLHHRQTYITSIKSLKSLNRKLYVTCRVSLIEHET